MNKRSRRSPSPAPRAASPLHVVVLAAGQGTRMKSRLPKVLHEVGGQPMLGHVLDLARSVGASACHVVHGHGAEAVRTWFDKAHPGDASVRWVLQAEQNGTGHAVLQALPGIPDDARVVTLLGDVPLLATATLQALLATAGSGMAMLTTVLADPTGYGRVVRDRAGRIRGIVEEKDATAAQRRIPEVNVGVFAVPARRLRAWLPRIRSNNAKGEYYLTDIVAMAAAASVAVRSVSADAAQVEGVNDRAQLANVERVFQRRRAQALMRDGLAIRDPARFDLRGELTFGVDCSIDVGVVLEGRVELGDRVSIGPYAVLRDVKIGAGTRIEPHCVIESMASGANCRIGPFARIRPGTELADDVHVGNFVELKNSTLGSGSKANHLAYIGDTTIGARVNVGAGVITVNYDGANKHQTVIGDDAFIGSDAQLIAPVRIGDGATVGAGSTITRDVPAGGLTVCRARDQKTLPSWQRPKKARST